jgi:hypothetical protein
MSTQDRNVTRHVSQLLGDGVKGRSRRLPVRDVLSAFAPSGGSGTLCSGKGVKRDEVPGMWIDGDQRAA